MKIVAKSLRIVANFGKGERMQIFTAAQDGRSRFSIVVCHKMVRNIPGDSAVGAWELRASFQNESVARRMFLRALQITGAEIVALVDQKADRVLGMLQR